MEAFSTWLEEKFTATDVNLHSIDVVADLRISRYRYLKMCGDMAKHNLARLATNVDHLGKLLKQAGHPVSEQQAYLAVEPFFEWFHENIFVYHSSQIAEFLNNIRWAIYEYLQPEFRRSWHIPETTTAESPRYSYHVPSVVTEPVAVAMYWDAMNRSRSRPFVQRFEIPTIMKKRY